MSDDALTTAIQDVLAATPFHGEGYRKVWARLRYAGTRTSMRRVLRLMRQNNLLAPTRVGSPRGPRNHDGTIIPDTVDAMWGTDLTTTITGEGQATVFIAVDHCSAECVGIHAHPQATRFQALEPIRQGVRQRFGGFGKASARGLAVRHDHDRNTCLTTSKRRSPSSASRVRPPSSGRPRAMAVPSGSSVPSRKTCCGCAALRPSRNCDRRDWTAAKPTTPPG